MTTGDSELTSVRIAYFQQITKEITETKARAWTFIVVCVAVVVAITNIATHDVSFLLKFFLTLAQLVASCSTAFMTYNSDEHLDDRRKILNEIYNRVPELKDLRQYGRKIDVTRKDLGDSFFTALGLYVVPIFSIIIVIMYLYKFC
jgi:hypothetical protein